MEVAASGDPTIPMLTLSISQVLRQANSSAAALQDDGNTYKNLYEATSMNSGLTVVVLINIFVSGLGLLFYRYFILKEAGLLTQDEIELLRKYPDAKHAYTYTVSDVYSFVRAPPPMRWTGWRDFFFTVNDRVLSRDAQVYLLFQRACILTTAGCGTIAAIILLPWYWFGDAIFRVGTDGKPPLTLLNMLKSDRGVFERFTSHNLPHDSQLILLQFPVMVVVAFCVIFLYTVVKTAAGELSRSTSEWLQCAQSPRSGYATSSPMSSPKLSHNRSSSRNSSSSPDSSPTWGGRRQKEWTLFVKGLPWDIHSARQLEQMINVLYTGSAPRVELVGDGRMSEVKLERELNAAKFRAEYLENMEDDDLANQRFASNTIFGRAFGLFIRRWSREEVLERLERKIAKLERDLNSRQSEPVRGFRRCAFVTFTDSRVASMMLKNGSDYREYDSAVNYHPDAPGYREHENLDFGVPSLSNLYVAVFNMFPRFLRTWINSIPMLAPQMSTDSDNERLLVGSPRHTQYQRKLVAARLRNMKATRAPKSADLIWDNLGISFFERTIRELMVQIVVFAILILFTSPIAMLTAGKLLISEVALLSDPDVIANHNNNSTATGNPLMPTIDVKSGNAAIAIATYVMNRLPPALSKNEWLRSAAFTYIPVLMLAVVFAVVPSLLRMTCQWEGYSTLSAQELSVFRKTAFYYVMNAVVLPSLALNSMSEFLEVIYKQSNGGANITSALPILERLFSGDIAFFLCNYLVQLALTGSVFWLMRIPSSFSMMIRRKMALTPLEAAEAKCTDIFDYPRHYAYCVTVMSMCLLFGFMAPLVWWFSFVYFVIKHAVDVYCIRYVHPRTHIDGRLPRLSIMFVLVWTVVSQLSIAVMFYLRCGIKSAVFSILLCALTIAGCLVTNNDMGNKILGVIAKSRVYLVQRVVGDGSNMFGWAIGEAHVQAHTSAVSLLEPLETDSLLATQTNRLVSGRGSYSEDEGNEYEEEEEDDEIRRANFNGNRNRRKLDLAIDVPPALNLDEDEEGDTGKSYSSSVSP